MSVVIFMKSETILSFIYVIYFAQICLTKIE